MLRSLFTLCTLSGVILLSGCKETKSEAWYKQHPDETYAVYTQCLKDGEASDNWVCSTGCHYVRSNWQAQNKRKI